MIPNSVRSGIVVLDNCNLIRSTSRSWLRNKGLEFIRCGLLIDEEYPFIGSSTDGLIKCYYCGKDL